MKKIILMMAALLLIVVSLAHAAGPEFTQKAGTYTVATKFERNPSVGNNDVEIAITDATGARITDARVRVDYSMPAMPGMPAVNYKANAVVSGDKYVAKVNPSMSGAWNFAVKITRGGKTSTGKFNVDVQ
ncbi:MAG: FixH family protein [Dissulfurispiraceae bacterium]